ncbi:MAG: beta-galactosidase [Clostridiales bacterium]|nr:beta-galactosidase [Clostridiales bacterium]
MRKKYFDFIIHGGDYNPDQWIRTKEIWDEDIRLMKLAGINSATVGIFSWGILEPEEGVFCFDWLDEIMEKFRKNGIAAILATPSGARPAWMALKYPEVLRVNENGIHNEYGDRHNHCLTSPVYREKVRTINRALAERYANHPALKMWHVSNEYSGECHCELCQTAFREWLKKEYNNDLNLLNDKWWTGFWSHQITDWSQISSPKDRGENHFSALKLAWRRFVTDSHISFFENEISPLRQITPDIPFTTNLMGLYGGIDYQKLASHLDIVSWDNYPDWCTGDNLYTAAQTAFVHDAFRSMKQGQPFFMMESTPSVVNQRPVNKLPPPGMQTLTALQAVSHGADSVQYFQWRSSRAGHEKYHGAVVDHRGHENTRVFREIARTGNLLSGLSQVTGTLCNSKVAIIYDWENARATEYFSGFNNKRRDYAGECVRWYMPFYKRGISVDVIAMDADYSKYDIVIAPFLYMLKPGTEERISTYVKNGGMFLSTYLLGMADRDDRCFTGGFPAGELKTVFGIEHEETDVLPEDAPGKANFNGVTYPVEHVCDIIRSTGAAVRGTYITDFYSGTPAVTENSYGKGSAVYVAFRSSDVLADDVCAYIINKTGVMPDTDIEYSGIEVRRRGDFIFCLNFTQENKTVKLKSSYTDIISGKTLSGDINIEKCGFLILKG